MKVLMSTIQSVIGKKNEMHFTHLDFVNDEISLISILAYGLSLTGSKVRIILPLSLSRF